MLVGGCVRDELMGVTPKDWDIEVYCVDSQRLRKILDEIGTPFCVTVDHETLEDNAVTVRDRDTWEQTRVPIEKLADQLRSRLIAG